MLSCRRVVSTRVSLQPQFWQRMPLPPPSMLAVLLAICWSVLGCLLGIHYLPAICASVRLGRLVADRCCLAETIDFATNAIANESHQ